MKLLGLYLIYIFIAMNATAQDIEYRTADFIGKVWEVHPGEDIIAVLKLLRPGDQMQLHEGIYEGSIIADISGLPDYPIIIRGYGNGEKRPVLSYKGSSKELLKITGNNLVFDYLEFRSKETYGIRIGSKGTGSNNITIENCVFYECGGGTISANFYNVSYDNIRVLNNYFIGPKRTAVYIGSHLGNTPVTHFIFKGNVIDGSQNDGPESTVGYGIELKLNVTKSVVENNFITGTKGPGIMVYGSENADETYSNIVRNNIIIHSRKEAGIVIGGGPSVIQNNVIIGCKSGMYVQNYDNRNLLENIVITGNTALDNSDFGISYGNVKDLVSRNNLVISKSDTASFKDPGDGSSDAHLQTSVLLDNLVDKIIHVIPKRDNLRKIWRQVSSGPLGIHEMEELIYLISEYSRPVKVIH